MIRFKINKSNIVLVTEWEEELMKSGLTATATTRMDQLRQAHGPEARIVIERDPSPSRAPQEWARFVMTERDGTVRFSNAVLKSEADALGSAIAADYPNATLARQEWVK